MRPSSMDEGRRGTCWPLAGLIFLTRTPPPVLYGHRPACHSTRWSARHGSRTDLGGLLPAPGPERGVGAGRVWKPAKYNPPPSASNVTATTRRIASTAPRRGPDAVFTATAPARWSRR